MKRMWTVKIGITAAGALLGSLVYFASDAQFDVLMAPGTRDAIYVTAHPRFDAVDHSVAWE